MATTEMTSTTQTTPLLNRKVFARVSLAQVLLIALIALSAALHFANLSAIGSSNQYYTAAVESMTQSWHNFFFVAAEPGGSVTVDKPPLGLWIETLFALVLGVSGFSTSLPNMLAGIFSVPLLYHLAKKYLGEAAGLIAALGMAVTPVVFAADRNNTMDGMLVFTLLLAAWAFIKATETGKLRHLLLGAFIVGLGFNIKMMQAFLPLPAFYALYFFGAKQGWGRKLLQLGLATILLLVVSLSWAVAVDLTPASQRPYIGSSTNNTVMELIIGHNGMERIFGMGYNQSQNTNAATTNITQNNPNTIFDDGQQSGGAFQNEIGTASVIRFFSTPLAKEMSWLLPLGLIGVLLALFVEKIRLPVESNLHKALLLWGGWLMTCVVFFSMAGFFHAYYMIMLAPALGGAIALGGVALWKLKENHPTLAAMLLIASSAITLGFQLYLASVMSATAWWMALPVAGLVSGSVALFITARQAEGRLMRAAYALILLALIIIPLGWSALTVVDARANVNLPAAYSGNMSTQNGPVGMNLPNGQRPALPMGNPPQGFQPPSGNFQGGNAPLNANGMGNQVSTEMLSYLQANTTDIKYLVAVASSQVGAPLVLETSRPVLYMGGFSGGDNVIDANGLATLVANNELRYVLWGGNGGPNNGNATIGTWLQQNCSVVTDFGSATASQQNAGNAQGQQLFACGGS